MIFTKKPVLKCALRSDRPVLKGIVNISRGSIDVYDGEYIVTPIPYDSQTLETKHKVMADDVTVLAIPYYETSNISGITIYIGGE
jgi:hypothetical protein